MKEALTCRYSFQGNFDEVAALLAPNEYESLDIEPVHHCELRAHLAGGDTMTDEKMQSTVTEGPKQAESKKTEQPQQQSQAIAGGRPSPVVAPGRGPLFRK